MGRNSCENRQVGRSVLEYAELLDGIRSGKTESFSEGDWVVVASSGELSFELIGNGSKDDLKRLQAKAFESQCSRLALLERGDGSHAMIPDEAWRDASFACSAMEASYSNARFVPCAEAPDGFWVWHVERFGKNGDAAKFMPSCAVSKDVAIRLVSLNGENFSHLPPKYRNDEEVYTAIAHCDKGIAFKSAGRAIRGNASFALAILRTHPECYEFVEGALHEADFFIRALSENDGLLEYAGEGVVDNEMCVWESVKANPMTLCYASERLLNSPSFAMQVCDGMDSGDFGRSFGMWSEKTRGNKEFLLSKMQDLCASGCFSKVPEKAKMDKDVALAAVAAHPSNFSELPECLKSDVGFVEKCISAVSEMGYDEIGRHRLMDLYESFSKESLSSSSFVGFLCSKGMENGDFDSRMYPAISGVDTDLMDGLRAAFSAGKEDFDEFVKRLSFKDRMEKKIHKKDDSQSKVQKI